MTNWTTYINFLLYALHFLLYCILTCLQNIYWRIVGIQHHLDRCKGGEDYETSAHLLKVWSRAKPVPMSIHYRRHFITTHEKFVHPEYALQKHITLMTVTDKEAIFCVPSPEENILNVAKWPFLFDAEYKTAKYILIMPIVSLIRLADDLGNPMEKIIWIHHPGRCGSTAIGQAFNALPGVVTISEPHCIFSLDQTFKSKYLTDGSRDWELSKEYQQIYQSVVRLILKPHLKAADTIVVKSAPMTGKVDIKLIPRLFPKFISIFMYREAKGQVSSLYKSTAGLNIQREATLAVASSPILSWLLPRVKPLAMMHNCCSDAVHTQWLFNVHNVRSSTEFIAFVVNWCEISFHYMKYCDGPSNKPNIPAFKYEHWQSNQDKYLQTLFHHIDLELTDERNRIVTNALTQDSQQQSYVSRDRVRHRRVEITPHMIDLADRYLCHYNLPRWGEALTLPNTVTSS